MAEAGCVQVLAAECIDRCIGHLYRTWSEIYGSESTVFIFGKSLDVLKRWSDERFETEAQRLLQQPAARDFEAQLNVAFKARVAQWAIVKGRPEYSVREVRTAEVLKPFLTGIIDTDDLRNTHYFSWPADSRSFLCAQALTTALDSLVEGKVDYYLTTHDEVRPEDSASQVGAPAPAINPVVAPAAVPAVPPAPAAPPAASAVSMLSSHHSEARPSEATAKTSQVRPASIKSSQSASAKSVTSRASRRAQSAV